MTYRHINYSALPTWLNPLKIVEHRPFLEDISFPVHSLGKGNALDDMAQNHPYSLLQRYYVKQRADGPVDVSGLRHFINKKPSGIYVIKGEVGAGKTWFLRYLTNFALKEEYEVNVHTGIIDMWHQKFPDTLDNAHWQLDIVLNDIVDNTIGLRTALLENARIYAETVVGNSKSRRYEEEVEAYFRKIQETSANQRMERNLLRLEYLEKERIPIIIGVDNIDRHSDDEQSRLFGVMVKLLRYPNVRLIVPVRPSTYFSTRICFDAGEFYYDDMELQKINYEAMFQARFDSSIDGINLNDQKIIIDRIDFDSKRDDGELAYVEIVQGQKGIVEISFPQILRIFMKGYGFTLLEQLADSDMRQALKLMRRVIYSDNLLSISNLEIGYHFISATMLRRSRDFRPDESYILNLFDDDHPDRPGNSLIRFRILEYFIKGNRRIDSDYFFKKYFERLGYDTEWVNSVLRFFVESGLLRSADGREGTLNEVEELVATRQGRLYYHTLIYNKWYLYCIKRGMAISEAYIRKRRVQKHVWREEVEDDQLAAFFNEEEELESSRIKQWEDDIGEDNTDRYGELKSVSKVVTETLNLQI